MMRSFKRLVFMKQRDKVIKKILAAIMPEKEFNEIVSFEKHET